MAAAERMHIKPQSRREKVVLVAGGLFIVACLIGSKFLPGWISRIRLKHESAIALIAEARRAAAMVETLEARLDSLETRKARSIGLTSSLFAVDSRTAADGALATLISSAAAANNVRLGAVQIRPDTTKQTIGNVSARATLVGDIRGVTGFLLDLEMGPQLISIRELSISQPEPEAGDDRPEALQVELVIEALFVDRTTYTKKP